MKISNDNKEAICLTHIICEMEILLIFKNREYTSLTPIEERAIARSFEVIGEACRRLSIEFTQKYDQIKWNKLIGLRNIVAHQYDKLDVRSLLGAINKQIEKDLELIKVILQEVS